MADPDAASSLFSSYDPAIRKRRESLVKEDALKNALFFFHTLFPQITLVSLALAFWNQGRHQLTGSC